MTEPGPTPTEQDSGQPMLTTYLAEHDALCPACGYNLRQLKGSTCPECGNTLELTVGVVGGVSAAWISSLVGALIAAGVGLPLLILLLTALGQGLRLSELTREEEGVVFLLLMAYSVFCMGVSVALLSGRRRFQSWSVEAQGRVAALLILGDVIWGFAALILLGRIMSF